MKKLGAYFSEKIFTYGDYRSFLNDAISYWQTNEMGSLRELSKQVGFTSPSLLGEIVGGRRALTATNAERLANGIGLSREAGRYLICLVIITHEKNTNAKVKAIEEMSRLISIASRVSTDDPSIHDSWLHSVIFELAKTKNFKPEPESIRQQLRVNIPRSEIEETLAFLEKKKFIQQNESTSTPANVSFKVINDLKRLNIQKKHLQFTQMAQHRLSDPLDEREFQGLTVAVKEGALETVKTRLREFIVAINDEIAEGSDADHVIRLQLSAYKLTKS